MENENEQKYGFGNPRKAEEIVASLDPLVKDWFFSRFKEFSLTQLYSVGTDCF